VEAAAEIRRARAARAARAARKTQAMRRLEPAAGPAGWELRVSGTRFVDANDQEFIPRGFGIGEWRKQQTLPGRVYGAASAG